MEFGMVDNIAVAFLTAALPIWGVWEHRRLHAWLAAGVKDARIKAYAIIMTVEWVLTIAVLGIWLGNGRALSDIGLGLELGLGWWIGIAAAAVACGLLIWQSVVTRSSTEKLKAMADQLGSLRALLPHNDRESRLFSALSVTAGICEEVLYRGFLMAFLAAHLNIWSAVLLSSLVFGLGHLYQGVVGVLKTGAVGLVMAGLFVLTGSLWAPILLHAAIDLNSGYLGRRAIETPASPTPATG